jgi:hypothetical protein
MWWITSSSLALLIAGSGVAFASPPGPERKVQLVPRIFGTEITAVNACVRTVRTVVPKSGFDAYVSPRGTTRTVGNEEETAVFRRCMRDKGLGNESN